MLEFSHNMILEKDGEHSTFEVIQHFGDTCL